MNSHLLFCGSRCNPSPQPGAPPPGVHNTPPPGSTSHYVNKLVETLFMFKQCLYIMVNMKPITSPLPLSP